MDMKKMARQLMREKMGKKAKEGMSSKGMKSVTVSSDSKEGLEEGLSLAEELLKAKKGKYMDGGYKLPEDLKEGLKQLTGKEYEEPEMEEEDDSSEYKTPEGVSEELKKLKKLFENRKR